MAASEPSGSPDARLRFPGVLRGACLLSALLLSGCASTTKLSWSGPNSAHDGATLQASLVDPESAAKALRTGDAGVVRTAVGPQATASTDAAVSTEAAAGPQAAPTEAAVSSVAAPTEAAPSTEAAPTEAAAGSQAAPTEAAPSTEAAPTEAAASTHPGDEIEPGPHRASTDEPIPLATGFDMASIPAPESEYPIDLTTALRLAEVENPKIAEARQRIGAALAERQQARVLLLPSLNFGGNYHGHTGNLQRSSGRILALDENSLYLGGGSGVMAASAAEIPAISIISQLTDALFRPLAAQQEVAATQFDAKAMTNNTLLEVAVLYYELLAAEAELVVRLETAEQAAEVARVTRAYATAQQGREADAQRAATELSLIVIEIRQAEEDVRVAAAKLTHRLHLNQSVLLRPMTPKVEMMTLIDPTAPLQDLIRVALVGRPEVGAATAAIVRAEVQKKQEQYRPLLPTLWLGFSGGVMGGGSNVVPPQLSHFGGRTDFDIRLYWTAKNFGLGNIALVKQRQAEIGMATGARSQAITTVRREVASAYAEVAATRFQVGVTTRQLKSGEAGFREDLARIKNTVGRPIEVVNSLHLLNDARVERIAAVKDYNQAQFKLFVSLGSPPPLDESAKEPIPPAPIAWPVLPALTAKAGDALVPPGRLPGPPPHSLVERVAP